MKTPKQSQTTVKVLLLLMVISTFMAVPVNGGDKGWWSVWGLEVESYRALFHAPGELNPMNWHLWVFTIAGLVHLAVIALPLLINHKNLGRLLYWIPLLYLFVVAVGFVYSLIFLIPFAIVWAITALIWHRVSKQQLQPLN